MYELRTEPRSPWSPLVVEHQSAEPEDLIFFSLSHACDKTKNIIPKLILQSKKVT